jgi:ankyrin repeat protein
MNPTSVPTTADTSHTLLSSEENRRDISTSSRDSYAISETAFTVSSTISGTLEHRIENDISGPNRQKDPKLSDQVTSLATQAVSEDVGSARYGKHCIVQTINGASATDGSSLFAGINVSGSPPHQPHFFYQPSYESYKNFNPRRVPGTCRWVFEHPTFVRWRDNDHDDLLWLSADPGCGKSVLSRALIDDELAGGDFASTSYYFFKDNEEQSGAARAVCALLYHIFSSQKCLFSKHAVPAIEEKGPQLVSDFEELWRLLIAAGTDPEAGKIICVLDALDECKQNERSKLLGKMEEYFLPARAGSKPGSSMKFFVTSRPYHQIERLFSNLANCVPSIRLAGEKESDLISQEINLVIKAKVRQIKEELRLSEEIQASLETRLSEIPHRTYLWLKLILDEIRGTLGKTEKKLIRLIKQLPETVNKAYEMLLAKCAKKEEAKRVLHIIIAAKRPLELKEMDVALEIDGDSKCYKDLDLEGDKNRGAYIRNLCGLFVTIVDEKIYLIHQTAKEFLMRQDGKDFKPGTWKHSLVPRESHRILADICITHLFFDEFRENPLLSQPVATLKAAQYQEETSQKKILQDQTASYSFLSYSANYWAAHFREADIKEDDKLTKFALDVIRVDSGMFLIYSGICYAQATFSEHGLIFESELGSRPEHLPTLYLAVTLGLEAVIKLLLKNEVNVNAKGGFHETAISAAAARGYKKIVELLLEAKADVNLQGGEHNTAFQAAAAEGYEEMVELLFQGGYYNTALQAAAARGHEEIVELLLEATADVNLQGGDYTTALQAAAARGHKKIVELLLEAKADVNLQDGYHNTALQAAAAKGYKEIIELLLEAKADVHLEGGDNGSALQAAIDKNHHQIEERLIDPWLQGLPSDEATFRERVRWQYPEALFERLDHTHDRVCVHSRWYEVERRQSDESHVEE